MLKGLCPLLPLTFRESSKPLIRSLAGPLFRLVPLMALFADARRRAANPQGLLLLEAGFFSSCCNSQALSLAKWTNLSSCVTLTFLLILRLGSKGFCMWRAAASGLFCSFPCAFQKGRKKVTHIYIHPHTPNIIKC